MTSRYCKPLHIGLTLAALLVVSAGSLFAQEAGPVEPDETEIVIPEFVLEVEELGVEEVEAVLPDESDLALGQITLPLPGADELEVSDISFNAPLPTSTVRTEAPQVFSTGRLGAGTANRIIGDISIYKLGADPRFRLGFAHEGIDGYQFNQAGSGFYGFTNTIDAWLSTGSNLLELEAEGIFSERESGLQNQSAYNAVSIRDTSATAELIWQPDPLVTISGGVDAGLATRRQKTTGAVPVPTDQEYLLSPTLGARFDIRAVDLIFQSTYFLRLLSGGAIPNQQDLDFTAGFEAAFSRPVVIAGHAGVHWNIPSGLEYPWSLSVRSLIGDALEIGATGGFRVERTSLSELWAVEDPLLAVGDSDGTPELRNNSVWFASADARWTGLAGLALRSEVAFTSESALFNLQPYDDDADEFPFEQVAEATTLSPSVQASWQPSPLWQFEAGFEANLLDKATVDPVATFDGAVRFAERTGVFRADLEVRSNLFPEPDVPWLGLAGTVTAAEGVEVVVELSDILSPLTGDGRAQHGPAVNPDDPNDPYPFIEPGFIATVFTRITL